MTKTHQQHGEKKFIEEQRDFFDKLSTQDWDTYHNESWDVSRIFEVSQIFKEVNMASRILDVGCGVGFRDALMAEQDGVKQVVGIDYSEKSIQQANRHYAHPKVERFVADIFDYQQLLDRFDQFNLIVSFQVIEHVNKQKEFLAACKALLNVGGYLAIVTPNRNRLDNRLNRLLGRDEAMADPLHFHEFTREELENLGESLGLQPVARFAHTLDLSTKRGKIGLGGPKIRVKLGAVFSDLGRVLGIVFKNKKIII